jgi:hypothetical protein
MARRKNVKRIDPRYFLHETVNRGEAVSPLEEGPDLESLTALAQRAGEGDPAAQDELIIKASEALGWSEKRLRALSGRYKPAKWVEIAKRISDPEAMAKIDADKLRAARTVPGLGHIPLGTKHSK